MPVAVSRFRILPTSLGSLTSPSPTVLPSLRSNGVVRAPNPEMLTGLWKLKGSASKPPEDEGRSGVDEVPPKPKSSSLSKTLR